MSDTAVLPGTWRRSPRRPIQKYRRHLRSIDMRPRLLGLFVGSNGRETTEKEYVSAISFNSSATSGGSHGLPWTHAEEINAEVVRFLS